jgi:hypothetical protein
VIDFWLIFWLVAFTALGGVIGWSLRGLFAERRHEDEP